MSIAVALGAYLLIGLIPYLANTGGAQHQMFRFGFAIGVGSVVTWAVWAFDRESAQPPAAPFSRRRANESRAVALQRDPNARFVRVRAGLFHPGGFYYTATGVPPVKFADTTFRRIQERSQAGPALVFDRGDRRWWYWQGAFWWENQGLSTEQFEALARQQIERQARRLDNAEMMLQISRHPDARQRRHTITVEMRRAVFMRDGGRCVQCGSGFDLEYDHVIPVAKGGATSINNLQLLCRPCNRSKGAAI